MPELCRFFGIIIPMFVEVQASHHAPHFHAYYQGHVAVYGIEPVEMLAGALPKRQQRLVEAWAELHQTELMADWDQLQGGHKPVLAGELYGPLLDLQLFNQVVVDSEIRTVVWPNGADFDPATLHDWPQHKDAFAARAREWERISA